MDKRSKYILIVGVGALLVSIFILVVGRAYFTRESRSGWVDIVPNNYPNSDIDNLVQDDSGVIWFGERRTIIETNDGVPGTKSYKSQPTIKSIDGEIIDIPIDFPEIETESFLFDNDGNLWIDRNKRDNIETFDILVRDAQGFWKRYTPSDEFRNFKLEAVDGNGKAWGWISLLDYTRLFTFIEIDEENMVFSFNNPSALEADAMTSKNNAYWVDGWVIDNQGNIWVIHENMLKTFGTDNRWIEKMDISKFGISCLTFDGQGNLWINDPSGNIFVLDREMREKKYPVSGKIVEYCAVDEKGQFWGYNSPYLFMFAPGGDWIVYDYENSGLEGATISDIIIDEQGRILVASYYGLTSFDPNNVSSVSQSETNNYIVYLVLPTIPKAIFLISVNVFALSLLAASQKSQVSDKKTLKRKNMRVFWFGATIAILGSWLVIWVTNFSYGLFRGYGIYDTGGVFNDILNFLITICFNLTLGVVVIQLVFYFMFRIFTSRGIEFSGVNMWIFLGFEYMLVVALILLIWGGVVQYWIT